MRARVLLLLTVGLITSANGVRADVITVGQGQQFQTISTAVTFANNNPNISYDIKVNPGTYIDDFSVVQVPLTIEAAVAPDPTTGPTVILQQKFITNDQGIIETFAPLTVNGLAIIGATAGDPNSSAAAIRDHNNGGGNLIVENSWIENSQNGIQTSSDTGTVHMENVTISNDRFVGNGGPIGPAHALYIGDAATADIINSTFCGTVDGHDIKSRALSTTVTGSTMWVGSNAGAPADCAVGSASAGVDLPNGGVGVLNNDTIIQGTSNQNGALVIYGGESPFTFASLDVSGTTFMGDGAPSSIGVNVIGGCPPGQPLVTGAATANFQNLGSNINPAACEASSVPPGVPEPRSIALLGAALVGFGLGYRNRPRRWA